VELLNTVPNPSADEVRIAISGNLCRCTGYEGIVAAALEAAEVIAASKEASK
jgi:carbon-monoxide dehydrogenase small subunit